jgi:hypothetical protein
MAASAAHKATSLSVPGATPPQPIVIEVGRPNVLTVGAGMEFATLGDALKAAVSGQTIAVEAGTYTNDFGTVSANVSIVAVGGLVHEVATVPPPDDKGILTVNANLAIKGFTFTGGSDGSPDGNVAGIRLQSGNLNVSYCSFTGMQEGLLADPDSTASVTIDHSFFLDNGTGDGLSHNLYVGAVKSLVVTNSLFEGAVVGHEIKSRAAFTTIENNTIIDGPTGTGSYDIDIPNGGVAVIENNLIEKGPDASNDYAIHYGGETQYSYAQNSLTVSGNTIINDLPGTVRSVAVLNQSTVTGANVTVQIHGNDFYNYSLGNLAIGAASIFGNTMLAARPVYSIQSPLPGMPLVQLGSGPQMLHLTTGNHTVTGGAGLLIVCDTAGSNSVSGGAGGMQISANAGWDQISTEAGAADTVNLPGRSSVLDSHGTDRIAAAGAYELIEATGQASIYGSGFSTYDLNGAGELLTTSCSGFLNVGAGGQALVHDLGGDLTLSVAAGGRLAIIDSADTPHGGAAALATVQGAVSGQIGNAGTITLTTAGAGAFVQAGSGPVSVTGGAGNDTLVAGSGMDVFSLGGGQDSVVFGSGAASVAGGAGADTFVFVGGAGGNDTISGFQPGTDTLKFEKFSGSAAIASGSVVGGSTLLTLSDGTTIDLAGVALPGYPQGSGGGGGSAGGSSGGSGTITSGSSGTLSTGGHDVVGGATLLTVTDSAGGNTIAGGAGGLVVVAGNSDVLSTASGSSNQLALACYDTLAGGGADQVTVSGYRNTITEAGVATLSVLGTANSVQGGGLLTLSDSVGGNSITGGAGGLVATLAGTYDQVTTAQGAADTVSLGGYGSLLSQGTDQIALSGLCDAVTVTGAASVTAGAGWSTFVLDGADTMATAGGFAATVGGGAAAMIASTGAGGNVDLCAGGTACVSQATASGTDAVTVSGGAATVSASGGFYAGLAVTVGGGCMVTAGAGPVTVGGLGAAGAAADTVTAGSGALVLNSGAEGVNLMAGSGNVTLNGGAGTDVFVGGSGAAQLNLGAGPDTVTLGNGSTTITGGTADVFVVPAGCDGTAMIQNFTAQDSFAGAGQGGSAIVSESVGGGGCWLSFSGGAQIELVGVSHFP